jgi:predicted ATPase
MSDAASPTGSFAPFPVATDAVQVLRRALREIIHLPGLRDNPARTYSLTAVGETFPGTFDNYFASIIARWQDEGATEKLEGLGDDLAALGLTWKVATRAVSDTQVEVKVGRLPHARQGGAHDLVSIADVGIGVSQVLPVLVALRAAQAGQLVYLEQPEIHLHPRAQGVLSSVLAAAVSRGVRIVVETHSAHLLLGVQTCVAEGKLLPEAVKLHWFERSPEDGTTQIIGADLNENGAFGDWPVDFTDVEFEADSAYLDAIDSRRRGAQAV